MIDIQSELEGKLWNVILDAYGYDEDTHMFLREVRDLGILKWLLIRARLLESDLVFLKYRKGVDIFPEDIKNATVIRRVMEILVNGEDSGKYLGPGDDRIAGQCRRGAPGMKYRVSGMFSIVTEAENAAEAKANVVRMLDLDGIEHCIVDVECAESATMRIRN